MPIEYGKAPEPGRDIRVALPLARRDAHVTGELMVEQCGKAAHRFPLFICCSRWPVGDTSPSDDSGGIPIAGVVGDVSQSHIAGETIEGIF
jgi:hypothetical protein